MLALTITGNLYAEVQDGVTYIGATDLKLVNTACRDTDDGATDPYGDSCVDYGDNLRWCGDGTWGDDDFSHDAMCCACGARGGDSVLADFTGSLEVGQPSVCADADDGATDPYGDDCTVYDSYPHWCGYNPDGEEACQGHGYTQTECEAIGCCQWDDDDDGDISCWSAVGTSSCTGSSDFWDDDDFSAEAMCCGCGGAATRTRTMKRARRCSSLASAAFGCSSRSHRLARSHSLHQ